MAIGAAHATERRQLEAATGRQRLLATNGPLNAFLAAGCRDVRAVFSGPLTYASLAAGKPVQITEVGHAAGRNSSTTTTGPAGFGMSGNTDFPLFSRTTRSPRSAAAAGTGGVEQIHSVIGEVGCLPARLRFLDVRAEQLGLALCRY
jgi:hypothetical protein